MRLIDEDRHENLGHALEGAHAAYAAGISAYNAEVEVALRGLEAMIKALFAAHVEGPRDTYEAIAAQARAFAASTADALEADGVDAGVVADWREAGPELDLVTVEEALDPVERHLWKDWFARGGRDSAVESTLRLGIDTVYWDHWSLLIEKE